MELIGRVLRRRRTAAGARERTIEEYLAFRGELRAALREGTPTALRAVLLRRAASQGGQVA